MNWPNNGMIFPSNNPYFLQLPTNYNQENNYFIFPFPVTAQFGNLNDYAQPTSHFP